MLGQVHVAIDAKRFAKLLRYRQLTLEDFRCLDHATKRLVRRAYLDAIKRTPARYWQE